jgi:hypothetical protein
MNLLFAAQLLPRTPKRKTFAQSKIFKDSTEDITTLAAIITAMESVAVRELCNEPQSVSRFPVSLIFCPLILYT